MAREKGCTAVEASGDLELVVKQMRGEYGVNESFLHHYTTEYTNWMRGSRGPRYGTSNERRTGDRQVSREGLLRLKYPSTLYAG